MSLCYILYSPILDRFYKGATNDAIENRISKHNSQNYGTDKFTAQTNDWEEFITIESIDFKHALRIEKYIKKMKSKVYIINLKKYPELKEKLFINIRDTKI